MASTISSLGIGSGVLTADVIDQLREADESRIIKPLDNKIELQNQRDTAFDLLGSLLTTFKSSVSSLGYDTLYQNRTVDVTGGDLEVTAEAGSNIESFTLETVELAQKEIQQSGTFTSKTDTVATGSGTMQVAGFDIAYTDTMTLQELADAINEEAGSKVTASILQTNTDAYSLILTSNETGADQAVTISDPDGNLVNELKAYDAATNPTGIQEVQAARDATFIYNGITINRSGNEVSDLINGVTLKLKTEGEIASVDIKQDQTAITTEMSLFVESYNTLISNLHDMTLSNQETGATGVFNGDSFIKSISRDINSVITSLNEDNNSLVNYGISLDKDGVMSLDESVLQEKLDDDAEGLELFFSGGYVSETGETKTGIFETLNDKIKSYTGYNGLMDNYESNLDKRLEALTDQRARQMASLDSRYEIMTKQFLAYDAMISRLNSQFSSLDMMIQADLNGS